MHSRQPTSLVISRHYCYKKFILLNDDSLRIFENRMCFTVQLSRLSVFASRLTAHLLYHLLFALSRTFLFYFLSSFFICISNSDIISCLQFPVNTFFIFFSTLFNQISVVCQKKSASLRSGFIISLFSFCVKYYFTFFYIFFTLSPISL